MVEYAKEDPAVNKVVGKVIVKETGVGIPNLLIVIYDIDPNSWPEEISCTTEAACR